MPANGRVLVVDDEPMSVDMLSMLLQVSGYEALKAYNGQEAVDKARESLPDAILLDIMMPVMSGYEATRALKNDPLTSTIPIALLTALGGTEEKVRGLDAGADDFLTKPVSREELLARVRSLIRLKKLQDTLKAGAGPEDAEPFIRNTPQAMEDNFILVLEDDAYSAGLYGVSLESAGYRVKIAGSGSDALNILKDARPALITFDLLLPDMDGLELLAKIKGNPETAEIPVLIISGLEDLRVKVKGIDTGADDYLIKPVNQLEFMARVRSALRKYALSQALKSRLDTAVSESFTDALTGLNNRRYLAAVSEKEMAAAKRYGRPLSAVMLDIDHFKRINDACGHISGDNVLAELGRLIRRNVRKCDIAVRYGGEEMLLILPDIGAEGALTVAGKLRAAVEDHKFSDVDDTVVTVSLGVTELIREDLAIEDLIKRADEGLYRAKESGRNRVERN